MAVKDTVFTATVCKSKFRKTAQCRRADHEKSCRHFTLVSKGRLSDRIPPPEEPSESPRHFPASMDESVIVGYYTLKKCLSAAPAVCIPQRKDKKSMARNDGIDRTVARNQDLETPADVAKVQEHNEREKDSYSNQDIVPERTSLNIHFKAPTDDYVKM